MSDQPMRDAEQREKVREALVEMIECAKPKERLALGAALNCEYGKGDKSGGDDLADALLASPAQPEGERCVQCGGSGFVGSTPDDQYPCPHCVSRALSAPPVSAGASAGPAGAMCSASLSGRHSRSEDRRAPWCQWCSGQLDESDHAIAPPPSGTGAPEVSEEMVDAFNKASCDRIDLHDELRCRGCIRAGIAAALEEARLNELQPRCKRCGFCAPTGFRSQSDLNADGICGHCVAATPEARDGE